MSEPEIIPCDICGKRISPHRAFVLYHHEDVLTDLRMVKTFSLTCSVTCYNASLTQFRAMLLERDNEVLVRNDQHE